MRSHHRQLLAEAERLGLHSIHFDWSRDHPWLIGEIGGRIIVQTFSFTMKSPRALANTVASLRRKVRRADLMNVHRSSRFCSTGTARHQSA